jgi:predicted acyltransferase
MGFLHKTMSENVLSNRLVSLDVFRGITIAGMVLVNNPGSWGAIYSPLEHAEWNGWTPTDLIFPFFLFIVGVSISLSLGKKIESGTVDKAIYLKIFRRFALIFLIGLFLHAMPFFNLSTLRIPGVLQRIAFCFLIASLIFIHTNWKQLTVVGIALLIIYWILMTAIPVPGCEITTMNDKACNLSAYIDRAVIGLDHIWKQGKVYDPEGILSTIPAIVTTISGILTGSWIRSKRENLEKVGGIFFFGLVLVTIGWAWNFFFPINKALWTSSYVVFTSGMALCFLGFCIWLIDIKNYRKWTKPFVIFGVNALALFVFSGIMSKLIDIVKVTGSEGKPIALKSWIFNNLFLQIASPINASLTFAVCYIFLWLFLMWLLYRKQIFFKV